MSMSYRKCLLLLSLWLSFIPNSFAQVVYVNASVHNRAATHNGSNWQHAYLRLQDALAQAKPGDQIWVAQGRYYACAKKDIPVIIQNA